MGLLKHSFLFISAILFLGVASCSVQENEEINKNEELLEYVITDLKDLNVDSLRNIRSFCRGRHPVYVMECWSIDSCKHIAFLLMRNKTNDINVKIGKRLVTIDSLNYLYPITELGYSKERIIYAFKVMEELNVNELNTSCNSRGFMLNTRGLNFYYLFDALYVPEYDKDTNFIILGDNWWWRVDYNR